MNCRTNASLANWTSLRVGGPADHLFEARTRHQVLELAGILGKFTVLSRGCNSLVADGGLRGSTVVWRGGESIETKPGNFIVDGGVQWDDFVRETIAGGYYGVELTSGIPGGVGASIIGNIAAYGQQSSECLLAVEILDFQGAPRWLARHELSFDYRTSSIAGKDYVVLRAVFGLSKSPTTDVKYASALRAAARLGLNPDTPANRRRIILDARRKAGALYDPTDPACSRTAGSFFRNPIVPLETALTLAGRDEAGLSSEDVLEQARIHGGSQLRASAAHVLIAAGFSRGQQFGQVRLHPDHVLKVQTLQGALAQDVANVSGHILRRVEDSLGILLEPEVRFLGFD